MKDLSDFYVLRSDEMIERAWKRAFEQLERFDSGNPQLDAAATSLARNMFGAGWIACLTAIIESENRKDGIGG